MKTFKIANVAKTAVFATVAGALALGLATPADAAATKGPKPSDLANGT